MAPKRRAAATASTARTGARQQEPQQPSRASKLAKQHNISSAQESEILEAFTLFSVRHPDFVGQVGESGVEGVLKRDDVRRCLIALGIQPSSSDLPSILETLDPTSTGFVPYGPFLGLAAIYLDDHSSNADSPSTSAVSSPPADLSEEDDYAAPASASKLKAKSGSTRKGKRKGNVQVVTDEEEVVAAYQLFTKGGTGPITLAHLRRVARELREEVSDEVLRDMILEANGESGGRGKDGWKRGVGVEEFENVMKRAGVFG
ncbi:hypothetical protein NA57DRAFT_51575 [Rhizodiscina lignyota]|uniref:EF-hand superfamily Ca2+-modulated protein n=1 Tax=Rhizodiscina lignyota TaxID=1504668 RepID=A0A9P4MBL1_9PEZI|nr:hypothetical protein NA57DRAFT_51575 [Rhizodiscina lignyota]